MADVFKTVQYREVFYVSIYIVFWKDYFVNIKIIRSDNVIERYQSVVRDDNTSFGSLGLQIFAILFIEPQL